VSAAPYITNGSHALPIAECYAETEMVQLSAPAGASWTRARQSAVRFPEKHAPKFARGLADFAARWGSRAPGYFADVVLLLLARMRAWQL